MEDIIIQLNYLKNYIAADEISGRETNITSWEHQEGILISTRQARILVAFIEAKLKEEGRLPD
jgi:hypothetical protein